MTTSHGGADELGPGEIDPGSGVVGWETVLSSQWVEQVMPGGSAEGMSVGATSEKGALEAAKLSLPYIPNPKKEAVKK